MPRQTQMQKWAEITGRERLTEAYKLIEQARAWLGGGEERWFQGAYTWPSRNDNYGRCCTIGAIARADSARHRDLSIESTHLNPINYVTTAAVTVAVHMFEYALKLKNDVPLWNDNPRRTYAEVLAGFDKALEKWKPYVDVADVPADAPSAALAA